MRRILWIILIVVCALGAAMIIHTPFRNWVVNGLQDTVLEPVGNGLSSVMASITATTVYLRYIQPYLFWWGALFGVIALVFSWKVVWTRAGRIREKAEAPMRKLQDKLEPSPPAAIPAATSPPAVVIQTTPTPKTTQTTSKEIAEEEKVEA